MKLLGDVNSGRNGRPELIFHLLQTALLTGLSIAITRLKVLAIPCLCLLASQLVSPGFITAVVDSLEDVQSTSIPTAPAAAAMEAPAKTPAEAPGSENGAGSPRAKACTTAPSSATAVDGDPISGDHRFLKSVWLAVGLFVILNVYTSDRWQQFQEDAVGAVPGVHVNREVPTGKLMYVRCVRLSSNSDRFHSTPLPRLTCVMDGNSFRLT